jgi:hypothetical protein
MVSGGYQYFWIDQIPAPAGLLNENGGVGSAALIFIP